MTQQITKHRKHRSALWICQAALGLSVNVATLANAASVSDEQSPDSKCITSGTIPTLVGTEWQEPGHFGYLHIDAGNVSGDDGCNMYGGINAGGAEGHGFVFCEDGTIAVSDHWRLVTTLRACWPEPKPSILLPSKDWQRYDLHGDTLDITTRSGEHHSLVRKS